VKLSFWDKFTRFDNLAKEEVAVGF
jgi:hypothetical protein